MSLFLNAAQIYNQSYNLIKGNGVPVDENKAFKLNLKAAEMGDSLAILAMGWFYLRGIGIPKNKEKGIEWYKKSARQKEPKAMFSIGQINYFDSNYRDAYIWLNRAFENGHKRSEYYIAALYYKGFYVEQNIIQANIHFQNAARNNIYEAKKYLAISSIMKKCKKS